MSYCTHTARVLSAHVNALLKRSGQIGIGLGAFTPILALANPTGGAVVSGQATIANPSANGTLITQRSNSAIINWQQFNIGAGQFVQFLQPSSSSVVLNRVIGGSPSSILGSLTANGQVFLVNTNGVYFGKGSSIDTQGFLASTLGITDQNFLAHNYVFNQPGASGATVINDGSITSHHGGYVVLAGDYAENDGIISAQSGHVVLASGSKATLALNGNNLVNFAVNQSTLASYAGVKNTGSILADGGTVIMTADVANLLKSTVVNNTGLVEAHAISKDGGVIQLLASGGNISNAGTLDVSATGKDQAGGDIVLKGDAKTFLTNTSNIDATGNGANGGSVEVSGNTLALRGGMKLGKGGRLLLDPESIEIVSSATTGGAGSLGKGTSATSPALTKLNVSFLKGQLNAGDSVAISAHKNITHAGSVTALTAISGASAGNAHLIFKTGTGGGIKLGGMDINIAGTLRASGGYGSFGHLTAKSIDIKASASYIQLAKATTNATGAVTVFTADATGGNLTLVANTNIHMSGSSTRAVMALQAKSNIDVLSGNVGLALGGAKLSAKASTGYAGFFGNVHAGSVAVTAGTSIEASGSIGAARDINLTAADGSMNISHIKAGGAVTLTDSHDNISAGSISGAGNVSLSAKAGNIKVGNLVKAGGLLSMAASAADGGIFIHNGAATLQAGDGITLSGDFMTHSSANAVHITTTTGNVNIGVGIGFSAEGFEASQLEIESGPGGKVDFSKNVFVDGALAVQAGHVVYTGTAASFELSARGGLSLDASIGAAKTPVKYAVTLKDSDGALDIQRSIFTTKGITITETGRSGGTSTHAGVFIANADGTPITLSAKGPITLTGTRVAVGFTGAGTTGGTLNRHILIGGAAPIVISADDGNSKTATDNLTLHATSGGASWGVTVRPSGRNNSSSNTPFISNASNAKQTVDQSITLHAGNDVTFQASDVRLAGGSVFAAVAGSGGSLHVLDGLSVTAGHDITISAQVVNIYGGFVRGNAEGGSKTETVSVQGGVSLDAGHDIQIDANNGDLSIHGGNVYGAATVSSSDTAKEKVSTTASAGVSFTAGTDIVLTQTGFGAKLVVAGGDSIGTASGARAELSGAVATVALHGDVDMTAGGMIKMDGQSVRLQAGNAAGGGFLQHSLSHAGTIAVIRTQVFADSKGAKATVTDTGDLSLNAGKGGISISAATSSLDIHGGGSVAAATVISATNASADADLDAEDTVSFSSKGAITLHGKTVDIRGGNNAAGGLSSLVSNGTTILPVTRTVRLTAHGGGTVGLTANAGVTFNATGAIGITAAPIPGSSLTLAAGGESSQQGLVVNLQSDNTKNAAKVSISSGLSISGGGAVTVLGDRVSLRGGDRALQSASIVAGAGTVSMTDIATVAVTGKSLGITGTSSGSRALQILAGSNAAVEFTLNAGLGAKAKATAAAGVALTATGGSIALDATVEFVELSGGKFTGYLDSIHAGKGASAALTATAGVSAKATGLFKADAGLGISFEGGRDAGAQGLVAASQGKAKASLTANASIDITAGSASISGFELGMAGGSRDAFQDAVRATGAASAVLKASSLINVAVTGALTIATSIASAGDLELRDAFVSKQDGDSTSVKAVGPGAAASLTADASVTLKAGGTLAVDLDLIDIGTGGNSVGSGLVVQAAQAGKATYLADTAVNLSAGKGLTIDAGGKLAIGGASKIGNSGDSAIASSSGVASLTVEAGVNLSAKGVVTLDAGSRLGIVADDSAGHELRVTAEGAASKAAGTIDGNITITGGGFSLTNANDRVHLTRGSNLGADMSINADGHTAAATGTVESGVSIAVSGSLTMNVGSGQINMGPRSSSHGSVFKDDVAKAGFGGVATGNLLANVSLSGGTVTLTAGSVALVGGSSLGLGAFISDGAKGTGKLTEEANTTLTAKGNLTVNAHDLAVLAGRDVGSMARLKTSSSGAVDIYTAQASAGIAAGGNVALGNTVTGINLRVEAATKTGKKVNVDVDEGSITGTVGGQAFITAGGSLKVHYIAMTVEAGNDAGSSMQGGVDYGKATLNINADSKLTAGGSVTLTETGSGSANFTVAGHNGAAGGISGGNIVTTGLATTKIGIDSSITVKAGTKLTLSPNTRLLMSVGSFGTPLEFVDEAGGGATAKIDDNINLTAKSVVASISSPDLVTVPQTTLVAGGVTETGAIKVSGGLSKLDFSPLSVSPQGLQLASVVSELGTLQQSALAISLETVLGTPAQAAQSRQPTLFIPFTLGVSLQTGSAGCGATLLEQTGHCLLKY
jgi:filamentous hemagglutinin family protein